jgi:predicted DNA-binding transcriptional regulator AlpA
MTQAYTVVIIPGALEREAAAAYVALGLSTWEELVRKRKAPQPRLLSGRRVGWLRVELDAWLLERPVSELLPPENTGADKPGRSKKAANDDAMQPDAPAARTAG